MKKKSGTYFTGIDSGGTKCELIIISPEKKIIYSKKYKGVHYSVAGAEEYSRKVSVYIKNALTETGLKLKDCSGICLGIAGAREDKDRKKIKSAFASKLKCEKIIITTDAMTALFGAFEGEDGIILISGTGSVLYGYSEGKITRVGGWGRIIGDEGSGYWIGRRALNLVTKEFDEIKEEGKRSLLSKMFFEKFGITNLNVNEKIFSGEIEIQNIAPVVIGSAELKCSKGLQIINESVEALTNHIKTFLKITNRKKPLGIAFIGSIIENRNILSFKLKKEIQKLRIVKVVEKKHSPSFGAALIAFSETELLTKL